MLLLLKGSKVTLCAQKMTKRLITLLVLLSVCHFGKIKCDCDQFFPNGLGRVFKIKDGSKESENGDQSKDSVSQTAD